MPFENFFEIPGSEYNEGVLLNKYDEKFSLMSAQKPRNGGTVFTKWVIPIYKNKPKQKEDGKYVMIPFALKLGNHRDAIHIVTNILAALTNVDPTELSKIVMKLKIEAQNGR